VPPVRSALCNHDRRGRRCTGAGLGGGNRRPR
jgi:hypothetical protein